MLEEAKAQSPSSQKYLWNFQSLLQSIPDWNQDKVVRETEAIQKDCKCDYLEELLTAVFIAHTKVLSAIRLTTKQKKLQITIPKIDHFLHRVMSDCARSLWANAFLFADTNSIEKQKNLRQVSGLVHESILQAIRGLLPVKAILREYLHDDGDEEETEKVVGVKKEDEDDDEETEEKAPEPEAKAPEPEAKAPEPEAKAPETEEKAPEPEAKAPEPEARVPEPVSEEKPPTQHPMIYIDTKPSVSFAQEHVMFDSNTLEENEIHDLPFAEAELREDEDAEEEEDVEKIHLTNEVLEMDADETLG